MKTYDGIALFSGGLDSLLASRVMQNQGKSVLGLHFHTPFFGKPSRIPHWEKEWGIPLQAVDIGDEFVEMLRGGPKHGYGSVLNPCVDCKILMLRLAKSLMKRYEARFIISGEVIGQRPMSQRRDTLNTIKREADVSDVLIRPLCAKHLEPTPLELDGIVDRNGLLDFNGRGRKPQLALAREFGIKEIPAPAGGCMLTEKENAPRYWSVLKRIDLPTARDFILANIGRQFWHERHWLIVGRHKADNEALRACMADGMFMVTIVGFPGPVAIGKSDEPWSGDLLREACSKVASYSPKASEWSRKTGRSISFSIFDGVNQTNLNVLPNRESLFTEMDKQTALDEIHALHKTNQR